MLLINAAVNKATQLPAKLAFISQGRIYRGRALLPNLLKRSIYSNRAVTNIL